MVAIGTSSPNSQRLRVADSERPEKRALAAARLHQVPVVVAKVDRLTRSVGYLSRLLEAGVDVRFADLPSIEGPAGGLCFSKWQPKKPCREDRGVCQPHPGQEFPMSIDVVSPLRQRMIEDMAARKLSAGTQRLHISSCRRFAAFLRRSPETATVEDVRRFQLHLAETGTSIPNRNRLMTGLRFLFRVTLRRLDLAAEIYHLREPQKIPQVISPDEARRLLAVANSLRTRLLLSLAYGCRLRASEVIQLKVKHIDSAQRIIRVEQGKGCKDRNVMLAPELLNLLRQWWRARPSHHDLERAARRRSAVMWRAARSARTPSSPTTAAVTGIAPSVRAPPPSSGSPNARPSCCPCLTSTWCSRCRRRSSTSLTRTRP